MLFPAINDSSTDSSSKLSNKSEVFSPCHTLHRKINKNVNDYSKEYIDDFKLIVVYPSPKLTDL